jgi:predicted nucleic acid-binding protein
MTMKKYCLDTNAFIEPWSKYYRPAFAAPYWEVLDDLGKKGIVFCPDQVKREIDKTDDGLKEWLKIRNYFVREETIEVQKRVREILQKFPHLISVGADRSMADPWVIAHAMVENAIVVSKEYITRENQKDTRIKIPDVCTYYKVPCINDYKFIEEVGIQFSVSMP